MAVCIVGAQMIMIPVALAAGRFAGSWGRKAVFLSAADSGRALYAER